MRRLLATAALGSALVLGFTGCGTEPPPSGSTTPGTTSTTATAEDILAATNAACNQAVSMSSDFADGFERDANLLFAEAAEGVSAQASVENFEAQMRAWSATLTSLATGPINDELRVILAESKTAIEAATEVGDTAFTDEQIAAVTAVPENLRAVCQ